MLFVGLTGGIGAGKSEALAACGRLGAATLSTDAVVHDLLGSDEVRDLLVQRWGDAVVSEGAVDRAAVAAIVFERPEELRWLESVLFPRVGLEVAEWRSALQNGDSPPRVAVVEVPLLFEAGIEGIFDATIAVVTDEQTQLSRAGERGHQGIEGRVERQLSGAEKADRADYVVRNDGSLEDLERARAEALERLGSEAAA